MADGYTIYNGPTKTVSNWFENFGYVQKKFNNPADTLLKLAHDPTLIHHELSIASLALDTKLNYKQPGPAYDEFIFRKFTTNIRKMGRHRATSRCKEFKILFMRNAKVAIKSPIGTIALIFLALFNSFILASIFGGVGKDQVEAPVPPLTRYTPEQLQEIVAHDR